MNIINPTTLNTVFNKVTGSDVPGELYIRLYPVTSPSSYIEITEADVLPGTFSIDRYTQSGDAFEIGTAYAAECKFTLENYSGRFSNIRLEGAEIRTYLRISGTLYELGRFTIDEKPRVLTNIPVTALDDMVKLDIECEDITEFDGMKIHNAVMHLCDVCGVSYSATDITNAFESTLRGASLSASIEQEQSETITYRQVLMWLLQLACLNAYISVDGKLTLRFYGSQNASLNAKYTRIDPDVRISADSLDEMSYGVFSMTTGNLTVRKGNNSEPFISNNTAYCLELDFSENPFVSFLETAYSGSTTLLQYVFSQRFSTFSYRPFKAKTLSMFWLEPLDKITCVSGSETIDTYISHSVFKYNGFMEFEIKSESQTRSGYATANPLTAYERGILKSLRESVTQRESNLIEFNKAMNAGTMLYSTDFSGKTYYHDKENLTDSDYILTVNSAGIAWTDEGWTGTLALPNTVWKYGFSCDGNAFLNSMDAYKINAELITVNDLRAFGATIGGWNIDEKSIYADVGKYRAYIQSASSASVSDVGDSWIFSTQELVSGAYQPRFYVSAKGELFAQQFISQKYVEARTYLQAGSYLKTGMQVDSFDSVIHSRIINGTEYIGKFGVGSLSSRGTTALELRANDTTIARLDVAQSSHSPDTVMLKTQTNIKNGSSTTTYNRYVFVGSNAVYLMKTDSAYSASSSMLNLYCGKIYSNDVDLTGAVDTLNNKTQHLGVATSGGITFTTCGALKLSGRLDASDVVISCSNLKFKHSGKFYSVEQAINKIISKIGLSWGGDITIQTDSYEDEGDEEIVYDIVDSE